MWVKLAPTEWSRAKIELVYRLVSLIDGPAARKNIPVFKPRNRYIYTLQRNLVQHVDAFRGMR